ncbi:MAG TPA: tyrosine-type recombinase/integrase [Pirellulales bacterium]|jgi:integrase|nr:tyrosine-type recombinase/integrase [Pirellulales bacterium]
MARAAKLRKKTVGVETYWYTESGGRPVYFGNVKEVKRKDAERAFLDHRQKSLASSAKPSNLQEISALQLADEYLDWASGALSEANTAMKKSVLTRWAAHRISGSLPGVGRTIGELAATQVGPHHLNDFISTRRKAIATAGRGVQRKKKSKDAGPGRLIGPTALSADMIHVKACFNWGADNGRLPKDFRPFAGVAKIKIPKRPKLESELPTQEEVAALFKWADYDLGRIRGEKGRYRHRTPDECRTGKANPYSGFADLLRLYLGLGPRTGEPATIKVKQVNLRKNQIVIEKHKRAGSSGQTRVYTINAAEHEILKRHCAGKSADDFVFTQGNGEPWTQDALGKRFKKIRKLAGVRAEITLYGFRHLWVSDAIESGVPMATIAEMAGTSIKQIEETYGHFRTAHKEDARATIDAYRASRAS